MKTIIDISSKNKSTILSYYRAAVLILVVALLASCAGAAGDNNGVAVTRIIDGDTIEVDIDGKTETVRLIGVDTPESVHPDASKNVPYGKVASEFTKTHLEGKTVTLEFDVEERDKYGRLLAYVYVDSEMFNKTLVEEGMAAIATFPPNVKHVEDFTAAQEEARDAGRGMWGESR